MVLYADGDGLCRAFAAARYNFRLHGRAFGIQIRAARINCERKTPDRESRPCFHRRAKSLRGEKEKHARVFAFPSSIDAAHFNQARNVEAEPADQKSIARPRFGYCGVIDERLDLTLLGETAKMRPDWQFVMIGPVVKISEEDLPRPANIHYLGGKDYQELPAYLSGWGVALMPFALNESTKYISPTKTPEYLAAGCPVVSTPIRDVVRPYGELGLVHIAETAEEFVAACEKALQENSNERLKQADEFLSEISWDKTWAQMANIIDEAISPRGIKLAIV